MRVDVAGKGEWGLFERRSGEEKEEDGMQLSASLSERPSKNQEKEEMVCKRDR